MLTGKKLRKSFGNVIALDDVDISIKPGQITTLIGPSGSGKTTLIRALSLLDPPDSGAISIYDKDYQFPLENNRKIEPPWPNVTVVFQQLFLWPHMTLRENITLPLKNRNKEDSEEHLKELIKMFEMQGFIDRYPNETSLGQRQRAALARALVLNPSYILMDEITSALDVEQVSIILKHLQLLRDEGIGILVVTHLIGFARRASDQVVVIDEGKVLEIGGREVLASPKNKRVQQFLSVIESAT